MSIETANAWNTSRHSGPPSSHAQTPLKGSEPAPGANPVLPTFEETYPKHPFSELVRLSLLLAQQLKRIGLKQRGKSPKSFSARSLASEPS